MKSVCVCVLSHVWLFVTPGLEEPDSSIPQSFPGKKTGVGSHFQLIYDKNYVLHFYYYYHYCHYWYLLL